MRIGWRKFWETCWQRTKASFENPIIIFYFLIFVGMVGGIGIWIDFLRKLKQYGLPNVPINIYENVVTYGIAIAVTALFDFVIRKINLPSSTRVDLMTREEKVNNSIHILMMAILTTVVAGLSIYCYIMQVNYWLLSGIILISWLVWIYANYDNDSFDSNIQENPSTYHGGDVNRGLREASINHSEIPEAII
ncbi:MAG: hypothetical protein Q4C89_09060 [Deinococcus sp.]|uniref:hypothetical protein n=1 Tax=Deinococcus sp. TaxID=47478 RepID=UPI0026DAC8A8|nr:hypothetical protein [Deinococcus sp.]MDO4246159.1 hypothetical protein [Deinococcus sp.]